MGTLRHLLFWCVRSGSPTVVSLLLACATLAAQGTTSRVTGLVSDPSGGVVPGATVTLTNEETTVSFTTITTDAGAYTFEAVQVGRYTIKVELQGFKTFSSTGNEVTIGTTKTVNAKMEAGALTESVDVIGGAETVELSSSGNYGTVVDQRSIEALPIVGTRGRNVLSLVETQPGVVSGGNTGGGVHVHGARDRSWNFTLDGIDINETSAGGANFSPLRTNPDSLAEFKVLTGNTTAEFGRNSGGQVAMVSRSGTNTFHGAGYYFGQRPSLNANEWENNINGLPKAEFVQNISGFSAGGPIRRGKAFFFVNTQFLRARRTDSFTRTVLTESARRGVWRYALGRQNLPAGVAGAVVDDAGHVLPGVGLGAYDVGANDPQRLGLSAEIQRLLNLTPLPNNFNAGDGLNLAGYTFSAVENEEQHDFSTKVDYVINQRHFAFARVSFGKQNTLCDQVNGGDPAFPGLPCRVDTNRDPNNWAGSWRWNPGSSLVNELVVGRNHFTFDFLSPQADPSRVTYTFADLEMPEDFQVGNLRTLNTFQIVDNVSYIRGAHSFKAGVNLRLQQHKDIRGSVGADNVSPVANFDPDVNSIDPLAFNLPAGINQDTDRDVLERHINFLLGRVGAITQGFVSAGGSYAPGGTTFVFDGRFNELDLYLQDTWKPRANLTVDLGLRWEMKFSPRNPQDLIRRPNQRVAVGETPSNTLNWVQDALYEDDLNNISPSIGAAWDPKGDGKSVIRGNYRLAYDRINTFVISSAIFQSIPGITTSITNTDFGQAGGRLPDVPSLQPTASPESFLQPRPSAGAINIMDTAFEAPMTHGWAFSYQRELWKQNVLQVAYIGRRADNLIGAYNVNQAIIGENGFLDAFNAVRAGGESTLMNQLLAGDTRRLAGETGSQFARRQFATQLQRNQVGAMASAIGSRLQGGRTLPEIAGLGSYFFFPFPQFLGGVRVIDSGDWSRYHALEVTLDRRFRGGVGYKLGYTLAKSTDTRSFDPAFTTVATGGNPSSSSTPFDIYRRELNFSPSDFDRRHVFQGSFVSSLPFGRGRWIGGNVSEALDRLVGGWELAGTVTVLSGRPFTIFSGSNTLSNVVQTPANCNACDPSTGGVFNDPETSFLFYLSPEERARFSTPGAGEFSNVGRNFFTGPGSVNINLALVKRARIVGPHMVEFKLEATNVTNTPTFGFPESGTQSPGVITNTAFGRIYDNVISAARRVQFGVKYAF